jgi:hypothetical protein
MVGLSALAVSRPITIRAWWELYRQIAPCYAVDDFVDMVRASPRVSAKIEIVAYLPAVIDVFPIAIESWYLCVDPVRFPQPSISCILRASINADGS